MMSVENLVPLTQTIDLVLIEPQSCFTPAFERLFASYARDVTVRSFLGFDAAAQAIAGADVVLVDLDAVGLDPVEAVDEIARRGGAATIGLTAQELFVRAADAPPALLGVVRKTAPPAQFVEDVLRAVSAQARVGIMPPGMSDRRAPGGALRFVGRDRRNAAAGKL